MKTAKSATSFAEKGDQTNKQPTNFIMLTNDDFKMPDESDGDRRFDNLTTNFEVLTLNGMTAGHSAPINNLMPPLPPRRSASATPTDSPLISPRHSSQRPARTHSTRINLQSDLDLDSRISEQSATFVKKPINYHPHHSNNSKNFSVSSSIFNGQNGADSFSSGGGAGSSNYLQENAQNGQTSGTNSFLNSSLSNLLDGELDGRPGQTKPAGRILKTSKSSLVFTSSFGGGASNNRRDDFDRPDDQDCLLTNVKAHELLESKEREMPFLDQHGKII